MVLQGADRIAPDQGCVLGQEGLRLARAIQDGMSQKLHLLQRLQHSRAVDPRVVFPPVQDVRVDCRLLAAFPRSALDPAAEVVHADLGLAVVGEDRARLPLAGVDRDAAIELQIGKAVQEQELVVGVALREVALALAVFVEVVRIADQAHVGLALPQSQGSGEPQLGDAEFQAAAVRQAVQALGKQPAGDIDPIAVDAATILAEQFGRLVAIVETDADGFQDIQGGFVDVLQLVGVNCVEFHGITFN